MLNYISYKIGNNPQKLVFFLHGYNGNITDHQYAIDWLKSSLSSAYLVIPEAPEICDKNPQKLQWFGMLKYDPQCLRTKTKTPIKEIFEIYNKSSEEISKRSKEVNKLIDAVQNEYNIKDENIYIIGFSQGAMLTIYTALTRNKEIAAAFPIAGIIAGYSLLEKEQKSHPKLYLHHGNADMKVQYKTHKQTLRWLKKHGINSECCTYPDTVHRITEQEIQNISKIINKNTEL